MKIDPRVKRNIRARVSLLRSSNSGDFRLSIEDASTGILIVEVNLNSEAIADLVSARMGESMPAEYYHNDRIGKEMTIRTFTVDYSTLDPKPFVNYGDQKNDLQRVLNLAEEQNPEWEADRSAYNSKQRQGDTYKVTLRKYTSQE